MYAVVCRADMHVFRLQLTGVAELYTSAITARTGRVISFATAETRQTIADAAAVAEEELQAQCEQLQAEALHREEYLREVISCAEWSESRILELDVKLISLRQRCERSDKKLQYCGSGGSTADTESRQQQCKQCLHEHELFTQLGLQFDATNAHKEQDRLRAVELAGVSQKLDDVRTQLHDVTCQLSEANEKHTKQRVLLESHDQHISRQNNNVTVKAVVRMLSHTELSPSHSRFKSSSEAYTLLESLEAVAAAAAENDDVRFTLEHENEKLQQQLAAVAVSEQSLTTQLQDTAVILVTGVNDC
eukprot:10728-Heterococcus_DN1.PRE.1